MESFCMDLSYGLSCSEADAFRQKTVAGES
jgi:hypothetical protein